MKQLQLITLFVVLGTTSLFAQSNEGKAKKLADAGKYEEAIEYYAKAISLTKSNKKKAELHNEIAYIYRYSKKNYEVAIEFYTKAIEYYRATSLTERYEDIGDIYHYDLKDDTKAIEYYTKAIEEDASCRDAYWNRGIAYGQIDEYEKAIEDYTKAISLTEDSDNKATLYENIGNNYENIGIDYENLKEYAKAIEYYIKALKYYIKAISLTEEAEADLYEDIRDVYKNLDDCTKAIKEDVSYKQPYINWLYAIVEPKKFVSNYVKDIITKWQMKGEFEKTSDYKERLTKRDEHIDLLKKEALILAREIFRASVNWNNKNISEYDADAESFELTIDSLKIFIHVPIAEAKQFKENVKSITFSESEFLLYNNKWIIEKVNLWSPQLNKKYTYNISDQPEYNPKTFITNFADIQIDIPEPDIDIKPTEESEIIKIGTSEIDKNLPKTGKKNATAFAVIIGNKNYEHTKPVNFAIKDVQSVKKYLITTLGYSPNNIFTIEDAKIGDFQLYFGTNGNHKGKLFNNITQGESDVFIYYSGHGAPGLKDKKGYFMPTDCEPNYMQVQGYSQDVFFDNLAMLPAKNTTIVIDACFSGTDVYTDIKGIIIPKPNNTIFKLKNGVLLTSSESTQVSCSYNDQNHSLFTYYFLKAIQDKNGSDTNRDNKLSFEEIYKYVSDNITGVPSVARKLGKEQTPTIRGNKEKILVDYR